MNPVKNAIPLDCIGMRAIKASMEVAKRRAGDNPTSCNHVAPRVHRRPFPFRLNVHLALPAVLLAVSFRAHSQADAQLVIVESDGIQVRMPKSYEKAVHREEPGQYAVLLSRRTSVGTCNGYSVREYRHTDVIVDLSEFLYFNDLRGVFGQIVNTAEVGRFPADEIEVVWLDIQRITLRNGIAAHLQESVVDNCSAVGLIPFRNRIIIDQKWKLSYTDSSGVTRESTRSNAAVMFVAPTLKGIVYGDRERFLARAKKKMLPTVWSFLWVME